LGKVEDEAEAEANCGMCRRIWRVQCWII
jgi:hypothetical protein